MEAFSDRYQAGRDLANKCQRYHGNENTIVLALPRGGVPVGFEISHALSLPLDIFVVRKLTLPGLEQIAIGAIATGNTEVFNEDILNQYNISQDEIDDIIERESLELDNLQKKYRGDRPELQIRNQTVLLVDDGITTGATVRAGIKALRWLRPAKIVLTLPVIDELNYSRFESMVDELIYIHKTKNTEHFKEWYTDSKSITEKTVYNLINKDTPSRPRT